jgi:hypothetical protein
LETENKSGFPAGTLVLTAKGYQEIENLSVGDLVLTHRGRFRQILKIDSCEAETILLSGNSVLESAKDIYILCGEQSKKPNVNIIEYWMWSADTISKNWALQSNILDFPIESITDFPDTKIKNVMTQAEFWRLVGNQITFNRAHDDVLMNQIYPNPKGFMTWMHKAVGTRTRQRCIPLFMMTLCTEFKQAFLDGFMTYNGGIEPNSNCYRYQSSNKKFIYGLRYIAESIGYNTHICLLNLPDKTVIFGRSVNQKPRYTISISGSPERFRGVQNIVHTFYKCSSIKPTDTIKTVYSLSVEEDNSFIADSIVVRCNYEYYSEGLS